MSKRSSNLFFFIAGAAVGAALGILYAPDKGKNTRDRLSFKLAKYREQLREVIENLNKEAGDGILNSARTEGQKVIQDAKTQAEKLLDDVENLIGQITSAGKK